MNRFHSHLRNLPSRLIDLIWNKNEHNSLQIVHFWLMWIDKQTFLFTNISSYPGREGRDGLTEWSTMHWYENIMVTRRSEKFWFWRHRPSVRTSVRTSTPRYKSKWNVTLETWETCVFQRENIWNNKLKTTREKAVFLFKSLEIFSWRQKRKLEEEIKPFKSASACLKI